MRDEKELGKALKEERDTIEIEGGPMSRFSTS